MTLQNTIIHLIGFPGVGKLTIAQAICTQAYFPHYKNKKNSRTGRGPVPSG